ncbi:MAG: hypothetical protein HYT86_00275, partial [candidate division NC10 bacterium]|nr:hypothetical protein [candidate division NC10 bacterium]
VTEASHGNAIGVGLADVTTDRLVRRLDRASTYANVLTSGFLERGKVPLAFASDRDAIAAALDQNRRRPREALRMAWIKNTLHLSDLLVSEALVPDLCGRSDLDLDPQPVPMAFAPDGRLDSPLRAPARPVPASAWRDVG